MPCCHSQSRFIPSACSTICPFRRSIQPPSTLSLAQLNTELLDRKEAVRNLRSQVQRLNGEYHAVRRQLEGAGVQLQEAQEKANAARADAEQAMDQVGWGRVVAVLVLLHVFGW